MEELILFIHRVAFKKENGTAGDLKITSKKILFNTNDISENKQIVWANVSGTKYSPSNDPDNRVVFRIELVDDPKKPLMFHFIGSSKDECKKELSRLRTIIDDFRKNKINTNNDDNITNNTANSNNNNLTKNRKRLLDADRSLKRLYEEFVEKDKIMNADDFWYILTIIIKQISIYNYICIGKVTRVN